MTSKRAILLVTITLLWLPAQIAPACPNCGERLIHYSFPFMIPVILILAAWRLAYAVIQIKTTSLPSSIIVKRTLFRLGTVTLAFLFILRGALLLYLIVSVCKAVFRIITAGYSRQELVKNSQRSF